MDERTNEQLTQVNAYDTDEMLDPLEDTPSSVDFQHTGSLNTQNDSVTSEDIEKTRAEMSGTIDAIQEKLSPKYIANQTKSAISEATHNAVNSAANTAKGTGMSVVDTIKENPIPSAMVALGLFWLLQNRRHTTSSQGSYSPADYSGSGNFPNGAANYRPDGNGATSKISEVASQVQDKAGAMVDKVQDKAANLGSKAQEKASRGADTLTRLEQENPFGMGLLAIALGAGVGMLLPMTQRESQLMGPTRDSLIDKAQDAVQNIGQNVENIAQDAVAAAKNTIKEEVKSGGLISS